jgi:hypothetical protein
MKLNSTELIHQNATPSLLRNSSFSQGLSHWFGSYCNQEVVAQEFTSAPLADQTPRHVANITTVDARYYMDGVTPGLNQFIDRPDIASFPSVIQVSGLEMKILDSVSALLVIRETLTSVDGVLLAALPPPASAVSPRDDEYFQHPFLFRSSEGSVPIEVGAPLQLSDARNLSNSELYRSVKTWLSFTQFGGTVPTPGQENAYSYHALEIVAPENVFTPFVSSESGFVVLELSDYRILPNPQTGFPQGSMTLTIRGDTGAVMTADRNQLGYPGGPGLRLGDTLTIGKYSFEISDFPLGNWVAGDPLQMLIQSPYNYGTVVRQFPASANIDTSIWAAYAPSVVAARVSKNLFKYEFTSFHTYSTLASAANTSLRFLELRSDSSKQYLTTKGFGFDGTLIPRKDSRTEFIKLDDGTTNPDSSWRRKAEYFSIESVSAIKGRLQLTMQPSDITPDTLGSFAVTDLQYQVPGTYLNVYFPNGRLSIGVNRVFNPDPVAGYIFQVDAAIATLEDAWKNALAAGPFSLVLFNQLTATNCDLVVHWPANVPAPTGIASVQVQLPNAAQMFGVAPHKRSRVTDVYLAKGNQSSRFQIVDDIVFPIQYPMSSNVLLDRMQHKTDELDNILPKGAVVLYTGGGVCPAGFKRIDGFRNSDVPGIPDFQTIPVPDIASGESIAYDPDTNRTTLTWLRDFSAIDETGATIPVPETITPTQLLIPDISGGSVTETVFAAATQQVMQPGMRFRCPTYQTPASVLSTSTGNPLFYNSTPGRAIRLTPVINNQAASGRIHLPVYDDIKIGPAFPNAVDIIFEMWVRIRALPTSGFAVLAQQRVGGGWEVSVGSDGNIRVTVTQGNSSSVFTTTSAPLDPAQPLPPSFLHVFVYLTRPDPLAGIEDGCTITIRPAVSGSSYLLNKTFVLPTGSVSSIATNSDIYLGRGAPSLTGQGLDCDIDQFRIFKTNALTVTRDFLFQDGKGITDLSQFPGAINALLAEYRLDSITGTQLANSAPSGQAAPGIAEGTTTRVPGLLTVASEGAFPTASFGMIRQDVTPSYLITNIDYEFFNAALTLDPATPFNPSGSKYGSGTKNLLIGGVGSNLIKVAYPFFVQSDAGGQGTPEPVLIKPAQLTVVPPGPLRTEQQLGRFGSTILGLVNSLWSVSTYSTIRSGTRTLRLDVDYNVTNTPNGSPGDLEFENNVTLGDVYYCVMYPGGNEYTSFFARVSLVDKINNLLQLVPYGASEFPSNIPPLTTSLPAFPINLRPATLFGTGTQGYDSVSQSLSLVGITATRTASSGKVYWSFRSFAYSSAVSVLGRLAPPATTSALTLDVSGYLVYDKPLDTAHFGNNGHSHIVDQGDVVTAADYVPRVNENNTIYSALPFVAVASRHTHGFLSRYRYTMPQFGAFTLCEKL